VSFRLSRGIVAATLAGLCALAACDEGSISGPSEVVGPPLLDLTLGPSPQFVNPTASGTINATRDQLTINLSYLPPLPAGSVYQVFLVDSQKVEGTANNLIPATGRLIRTVRTRRPVTRDSSVAVVSVDTTASTNTILATDTTESFSFLITNASLGDLIANYSHVVVAVSPTAVTAPGRLERTVRRGFLSGRYRNAANNSFSNPTFTFGSFAIDANRRLPFVVSGSQNGAFWGDQIRVNFRNLIRPPEGFQYAGWLIDDRTGREVRIGTLSTPPPENRSLANADVENGSFLSGSAVLAAQLRGDTASLGDIRWDDFTRFALLLEPKGTPTKASSALVIAAQIPNAVATRHPGAGKLYGTVTDGGAPAVNATIYVTGAQASLPAPLLTTTSDEEGNWRFRSIPVGSYIVNAIPAGDTQVRAQVPVTIGATGQVGDSVFVTVAIP
jgi:hypothetical protein